MRYRIMAVSLIVMVITTYFRASSVSAEDSCDHHVYPGVMKVFGNNLNGQVVQPGDRVCVHAGTYAENKLELLNFVGEEQNPIIIVNMGGKVIVKGTLYLTSSRYVVLDGSGTEGITYGFKVIGPQKGPGLSSGQYKSSSGSRGYEISHIEIHHVEILFDANHGNAGVDARNDNGSGPLENVALHDIYIHRTKRSPIETSGTYTEGFYIGSSHYESENVSIVERISIYNNVVEDAGWDGIQVGSASGGDCRIFNNTVIRDSREYLKWQHSGIRVNPGSQCDVYNNKILDSHGPGIYYYHSNGGHVYNNLVVLAEQIEREPTLPWHLPPNRYPITDDYGETRRGILIDSAIDVKTGRKWDVFVYNNTIVKARDSSILFSNTDRISNYKIFNNLIVNSDGISGVDLGRVFNNYIGDDSSVHFFDFANGDYHLTGQSSVAVDKGVWDSNNQAVSDLDGQPRVGLPDIGAFEYAGSLPTATPTAVPTPSDSLELEAEDMALTFPMIIYDDATASGGKYIQTTQGGSGTASYVFNVAEAGEYKIEAKVMAPDTGTNSFYVAMNQDPQDPQDIWDVLCGGEQNSSWTWDEVAQRGDGTFDKPQYDPRIFNLSVGTHYLYIKGREAGTKLDWLRIVRIAPTNTPTPTPTETLSPTPTPTVTSTPLPTYMPMPTFTSVPSPTNSPTPMNTPSPTATNTPTPLPTDTPIPTNTAIPSFNTPTPTLTSVPSPIKTSTPTHTPVLTNTPWPTDTSTLTPTSTPTPTATDTPLPTYTPTLTVTSTPRPTNTPTSVPTDTSTLTPASTPTPTATDTPLPTYTPTLTATSTPRPTNTPTSVPTDTSTLTPASTPTPTATDTPLPTYTPTLTATSTPRPTNTPTSVPTDTSTLTPTSTPTPTATDTPLPTYTPAATSTSLPSPTNTPTSSPTNMPELTATSTPPPATPRATSTLSPMSTPTPTPDATATPTFVRLSFDEPLFAGATVVKGNGIPGALVVVRDLDDVRIVATGNVNSEGRYEIDLTSVLGAFQLSGLETGHRIQAESERQIYQAIVQSPIAVQVQVFLPFVSKSSLTNPGDGDQPPPPPRRP